MRASMVCLLLILGRSSVTMGDDAEGLALFEKKIRPVLVEHCYQCHSAGSKEVKGGLLLDTRAGARKGGETGHAVVPGDLDESVIIGALRYDSYEMPPKKKLSDAVIADFEKWIRLGAPDPRDSDTVAIRREIDFEEGRRHWAFQPPISPKLPAVRQADWPRNEIDYFVLAGLEENGLSPVGDADRTVLVRRLYLDLIGLPPTPQEISRFVNDPSPDAVARLVDELLESPHFGERWGRHWLDVARYAESNGRERNFLYPVAWRYRDYVIAAFNEGKPYDEFVREQIAGDLLESSPAPDKQLQRMVATGFLAIGPKSLNENNSETFLMDIVDEQIDVTTRAFMGLTVSCARCHDHKFDPVPTSEYYALAGIFRSSEPLYGTAGRGNRQPSQLMELGEGAAEYREHRARVTELNKQLKTSQTQLARLEGRPAQQKKIVANNVNQKKKQAAAAAKKAAARKAAAKKAAAKKASGDQQDVESAADADSVVDDSQQAQPTNPAAARIATVSARVDELKKKLAALASSAPPEPIRAMGIRDGSAKDCNILIRGETRNLGDVSPRGYLTILTPPDVETPQISGAGSGRLELAQWLSDRANPLTARVAVNRMWQHLFERGLVRTTDNFGATGERPSNQPLLDYLAVRFMDEGWSTKRMIREIVLSRTYQLASDRTAEGHSSDPDNVHLWRQNFRRLDAEALRDSVLSASGQLNREPADGSVVETLGDGILGRNVAARAIDAPNSHRSVYLPIVRNGVPDVLRLFDFAEPSMLVGQRDHTTVPSQALFFLNNPWILDQSQLIAERVTGKAQDDAGRVELAYLWILSRPPTPAESDRAVGFIALSDESVDGWSGLCQALLASAEFRYLE